RKIIIKSCPFFMAHLIVLLLFLLNITRLDAQQSNYTRPALSSPDSWSLILLPDPQAYMKFERNQPIFDLMNTWISENVKRLNIKAVLCTGDLVDKNELLIPDGVKANQTSAQQWDAISRSFSKLDGKVPYITATGNHDYGIFNFENRKTNFNNHFPYYKNSKNLAILKEVGLNIDSVPTLENACYEIEVPLGGKFLILCLEYLPRNEIINWAKSIVDNPLYEKHKVILLTHFYMGSNNERLALSRKRHQNVNDGIDLWEKLVYPSVNICAVFAGHI